MYSSNSKSLQYSESRQAETKLEDVEHCWGNSSSPLFYIANWKDPNRAPYPNESHFAKEDELWVK